MKRPESMSNADRLPVAAASTPSAAVHGAWDIAGLTCEADALRLEHRLERLRGVLDAVVNPVTERAYVTFDPRGLSESELRAAILRFGDRAGDGVH